MSVPISDVTRFLIALGLLISPSLILAKANAVHAGHRAMVGYRVGAGLLYALGGIAFLWWWFN